MARLDIQNSPRVFSKPALGDARPCLGPTDPDAFGLLGARQSPYAHVD